MNKKKLVLTIISVLFFVAVFTSGYYFLRLPQINNNTPAAVLPDPLFGWKFPEGVFPITQPSAGSGQNLFDFQIAYSTIRDPGGLPQGLPVRLKIPIISVDSAIEDALITPDGRMDVPAGSVNVAWFALGPHPGQVGSAVIGGHFGINNGVKFVFYDLDKLKIGDKVYILDDFGNTLGFQVRSIKSFDRNADATTVFTSNDGLAHLNLITCEGVWNRVNGTYPDRLVIFTDAIPPENASVKPLLPAAGSTNPVKIPPVVTTPSPVATTTPTPSSTPAAVPAVLTPVIIPTSTAASTPTTTAYSNLTQAVKSLYSTPTDGIVSSLLIISIIFLVFKITRP